MSAPGEKRSWRWRVVTGCALLLILGILVAALVIGMTDPPVAKVRLRDGRLLVIEAVSRPDQEVLRGPLLARALYPLVPQSWHDHLGVEAYPKRAVTEMTVWYRVTPNREWNPFPPAEVVDANGAVGTVRDVLVSGALRPGSPEQLTFRNFPRRLPTLELRVFQTDYSLPPLLGSVVIPNYYRSSVPQHSAPALPIRVRDRTLALELLEVRIRKGPTQKAPEEVPAESPPYPVQFRVRVKYRGAVSREWVLTDCTSKDATGNSLEGNFDSGVPDRDGSAWFQTMLNGISTEPSLRFRFTLSYQPDGIESFPETVMREAGCGLPPAGRWQRFPTPPGPPLPFVPLAIHGGEKRGGHAGKPTLSQLWFRLNDAALPRWSSFNVEVKDDRGRPIPYTDLRADWHLPVSVPPMDGRYAVKFRPPAGARRVRVRYGVDSRPTLELETPNPYFGKHRSSGGSG